MAIPLSCCFSLSSLHPISMRPCPNSTLMPQNHQKIRELLITNASDHQSMGSKSEEKRLLLLLFLRRSYTAIPRLNTTFRRSGRTHCSLPSNPAIPPSDTDTDTALHDGSNTAFLASPSETAFLESDVHGNFSDSILVEDEKMEQSMAGFYNWEDQWYPLYLTREVPRDAPLALQVFHKQLVLHFDGHGVLHCYEDRCPHRLAKLSEGQIIDGRLECLYHGWQFEGDGQCVKIPQLPKGAKIPNAACVRSFPVCDVQGVVWVWMGADKSKADTTKIPHFDQFDDPHNKHVSSIHALPYDHSILLENLMDPAHVPISHDKTDITAKRENAQALKFEITERTPMGFSGRWGESSSDGFLSFMRFQAPCVLSNEKRTIEKDGSETRVGAIFMCRPSGLGKSMLIVRFGFLASGPKRRNNNNNNNTFPVPEWLFHQVSNKVFEQDMGFLASQNEALMREKVPTSLLYLNLRTSDVFVMEYRKWLDKVGHGMPYYFGHKTLSLPSTNPMLEECPAGSVAAIASSQPTKGATTLALGLPFSLDPTSRYFRHVVHCAMCRKALKNFLFGQKLLIALALLCGALGVALYTRSSLRIGLVLSSVLCALGSYACQIGINMLTTNTVRPHRQ